MQPQVNSLLRAVIARTHVWTSPWIIFGAGVIVRGLVVFITRPYLNLQRYEMERAAISLAQTGVLGNPYAIPTGPTAHVAPLYAGLLAIVFSVFGTGIEGEIVKVCMSTVLSIMPYVFMPKLAESLGLERSIGFWGGLLGAVLTLKPGVDLLGDWEAPLVSGLLVFCLAGLADAWRERKFPARAAVQQGVAWGLALLTTPALLPLLFAAVLTGFLVLRRARASYARFAVVHVVVAIAFLVPWAVRNYSQLGYPVFMRTNPGLELRLSNNDLADANEKTNLRRGLYERYHPLQSRREAEKVLALGEVEYNNLALADARAWIRSRPARFVELTLGRIKLFWFPEVDRIRSFVLSCLSIAAVGGTLVLLRRNAGSGLLLLCVLAVYPLPNYLVHSMIRHRSPIDWIGFLGAAILTDAALRAWRSRVT